MFQRINVSAFQYLNVLLGDILKLNVFDLAILISIMYMRHAIQQLFQINIKITNSYRRFMVHVWKYFINQLKLIYLIMPVRGVLALLNDINAHINTLFVVHNNTKMFYNYMRFKLL